MIISRFQLIITYKRYDKASGEWKITGEKISIPDVCNSKLPMKPFLDKFNGTIDHKTCTVEPVSSI